MTDITVYYLEMTSRDQHRRVEKKSALRLEEALVPQGKVNRFLYDLVGEPWQWLDRKDWSIEQWEEYTGNSNLRTFIALIDGSIGGYFELRKADNDTEIAYFGLAPSFTSRGFGGSFLSCAIDTAWAWEQTGLVLLNTCTLDHPSALGNYQKRGFSVVRQKQVTA